MKLCLQCSRRFDSVNWKCPDCLYQPHERDGFPAFAPELSSDTGFKDSLFQELIILEARNFWFRARNRLILWALKRYFPKAGSFLEVGCGTGFVLSGVASALPKLKLVGSEVSTAGLAHAAVRVPGAELLQMDARRIPFIDEFDLIGAFDVLEHIEEDDVVLSQMYQAVCPGGGILLTVPQHDFLWSRTDDHACHIRRYSASELFDKVCAAGFKVERVTSFLSMLLPLMLISRLRQRKENENNSYDPLAELRIGGLINLLFASIMSIERMIIRSGLNLPMGGSLLLIARKVA